MVLPLWTEDLLFHCKALQAAWANLGMTPQSSITKSARETATISRPASATPLKRSCSTATSRCRWFDRLVLAVLAGSDTESHRRQGEKHAHAFNHQPHSEPGGILWFPTGR